MSLTGYQVNAPYGSCIVHASPLRSARSPSPSVASGRLDGIRISCGWPWYRTTSVAVASAASVAGTVILSAGLSVAVPVVPFTLAASTVYQCPKSSVSAVTGRTARTVSVAAPVSSFVPGTQPSTRS